MGTPAQDCGQQAAKDEIVELCRWLLATRDIGMHDIVHRLEEFERAAWLRGRQSLEKQNE